jgi:hypothetical protein
MSGLKLKKECTVSPPAFKAATPVGARMTVFLFIFETQYFKNVVLPVPALPVTKTQSFVFEISSKACLNSPLISIVIYAFLTACAAWISD